MQQPGDARGGHAERGAALVEFALLLPLLLLIALGIVEFGYALSQQLDVRHGAREASRMIATDDWNLSEACNRMDVSTGSNITLAGAGGGVGDEAIVTVVSPLTQITGFFGGWFPATLESEVRVRIEQPPSSWANGTGSC